MKRKGFLLTCVALTVLLAGCGNKVSKEDTTSVSVDKNGKVYSTVVDTLDKEYYDTDELHAMIIAEIESYNEKESSEKVTLDAADLTKEKSVVTMSYADADSYAAFNDMIFFQGTVAEAGEAGYDLDPGQLQSADIDGKEVDMEALLGAEDTRVLILEEPIQVHTYGIIKAMSGNVTILNKKEAAVTEAEDGQPGILLFKP
ncbi:MAG: hypothetical protein PHE02_14050 [Lachnospiraceae bacterium]|nr:hypothetical protein [Lachnospiraceae bacterium]